MKKSRFLSLILSLLLVCSILAPTAAAAGQFTDVPSDAFYADAVEWAVTRGITKGTSATTFSPNLVCTRAQMVTFLWRMSGSPVVPNAEMAFVDVPASAYYHDAVLWATTQGITEGIDKTHFGPDLYVTRAQAVTFLWRADGSKEPAGKSGFVDVPEDAYYAKAVAWAKEQGITTGKDAAHFAPNDPCTRAQIVTFLYRYACGSGSVLTTTKYPVILVHGLLGWGEYDDINSLIAYWGMTATNTVKYLRSQGVEAYAASVGPFSSAWDRACELYAQLTGTVTDYGAAHAAKYGHERYGRDYSGGKYSKLIDGVWDAKHPVNLVGHSFGGATSRLMLDLLAEGSAEELAYMKAHPECGTISPLFTGGKADWVYSITALAAPSNGTTFIEANNGFTYTIAQLGEELAKILGLSSFKGLYDFQLEHFGIQPYPGQDFSSALQNALSSKLLNHNDNAFHDLTIDKALYINKDIQMQPNVYYFSYYGNRMIYDPLANVSRPSPRMWFVVQIQAGRMGRYIGTTEGKFADGYGDYRRLVSVPPTTTDASWWPNDGLVNVVSGRWPAHWENGSWIEDPHIQANVGVTGARPGVWYVMPELFFDHLSFCGGLLNENAFEILRFYDGMISNIVNCGG
ncbi:MAG: S-layer homology domain-containing protein [Oscillospiraceae bacterium]|nr:S-layer homology domain-containing protein [Oscillospiraceae bacterium]